MTSIWNRVHEWARALVYTWTWYERLAHTGAEMAATASHRVAPNIVGMSTNANGKRAEYNSTVM